MFFKRNDTMYRCETRNLVALSLLVLTAVSAAVFMQNHASVQKKFQPPRTAYSQWTNKEFTRRATNQSTEDMLLQKAIKQRNDLSKQLNDMQVIYFIILNVYGDTSKSWQMRCTGRACNLFT